jgi:hypothetical protein
MQDVHVKSNPRLTGFVENEEVLQTLKEERNTLYTIKGRSVNWIGHIMHSNYLLKYAI